MHTGDAFLQESMQGTQLLLVNSVSHPRLCTRSAAVHAHPEADHGADAPAGARAAAHAGTSPRAVTEPVVALAALPVAPSPAAFPIAAASVSSTTAAVALPAAAVAAASLTAAAQSGTSESSATEPVTALAAAAILCVPVSVPLLVVSWSVGLGMAGVTAVLLRCQYRRMTCFGSGKRSVTSASARSSLPLLADGTLDRDHPYGAAKLQRSHDSEALPIVHAQCVRQPTTTMIPATRHAAPLVATQR